MRDAWANSQRPFPPTQKSNYGSEFDISIVLAEWRFIRLIIPLGLPLIPRPTTATANKKEEEEEEEKEGRRGKGRARKERREAEETDVRTELFVALVTRP